MNTLLALIVALTTIVPPDLDKLTYAAIVHATRDQLASIPNVRVFVLERTIVIRRDEIDRLVADMPRDTGEHSAFVSIRRSRAYDEMFVRSARALEIPAVEGALVVTSAPASLTCETVNGELSRDVVLAFGRPGYAAGGSEAVVYVSVRDCLSEAKGVFLVKHDAGEWRVEQSAWLHSVGE